MGVLHVCTAYALYVVNVGVVGPQTLRRMHCCRLLATQVDIFSLAPTCDHSRPAAEVTNRQD